MFMLPIWAEFVQVISVTMNGTDFTYIGGKLGQTGGEPVSPADVLCCL